MLGFASKFIVPVKPTMFWFPNSFTVVSELKRGFQEAWMIMVLFFLVLQMLLGRWP